MLDDIVKEFDSIFEGLIWINHEYRHPNWKKDINLIYRKYFIDERIKNKLFFDTFENVKKTLYELNNQNSQIALIREIIIKFYKYENLLETGKNNEIFEEVKHFRRNDDYIDKAPVHYLYVYEVYYLYHSFISDIKELCFLFGIDYNTLLDEHINRFKPLTPSLVVEVKENNYKRHLLNDELYFRTPKAIYNEYCSIEYEYINIECFNEIPIPLFILLGLKHDKIDIAKIPMQEYAKGFIEGYNKDFIPFIDTADTRKEVVLYDCIKGINGFTTSFLLYFLLYS